MIRVFVDASVLFAASYSATGASREIIRYAFRGEVRLIISDFVLEEAKRNLTAKLPEALEILHQIVDSIPWEKVTPTEQEVQEVATYTAHKDAPVVAAARRAQAYYLTSLDRRHLVGNFEVSRRSGVRIVLPEEVLKHLRSGSPSDV